MTFDSFLNNSKSTFYENGKKRGKFDRRKGVTPHKPCAQCHNSLESTNKRKICENETQRWGINLKCECCCAITTFNSFVYVFFSVRTMSKWDEEEEEELRFRVCAICKPSKETWARWHCCRSSSSSTSTSTNFHHYYSLSVIRHTRHSHHRSHRIHVLVCRVHWIR